jgi:hypothetical protein
LKTTFGPGVIVTSKWLNGAKEIFFDGLDADWHYQPINGKDIQRGGSDGLDGVYVTVTTDQEFGSNPGITGRKSFMSRVQFGDKTNSSGFVSPLSWNTNARFNTGGDDQSFSLKFANLEDADLVTKQVLSEQISSFPVIDEGFF